MIIVHFDTVSLSPSALMSPCVFWESLARFGHATIYLKYIRILQNNNINIVVSPATMYDRPANAAEPLTAEKVKPSPEPERKVVASANRSGSNTGKGRRDDTHVAKELFLI